MSNETLSAPSIWMIFICYNKPFFWVIQIPTLKMPKLFVDILQDLGYASGWPSRPVVPIFKVKGAPKHAYPPFGGFSCGIANHFLNDPDSNTENTKKNLEVCQNLGYASGWPSRPVQSIFKVKRAPECAYLPFRWILCVIENHFMGDLDSEVKNVKNFVDVWQDLCYEFGWPSRPVQSILKVKRSPKRTYPPFRWFSWAIANHFLGDPDSDVNIAKIFVDVRQNLRYSSSWLSQLVRPILKVKQAPKRIPPPPSFDNFRVQ